MKWLKHLIKQTYYDNKDNTKRHQRFLGGIISTLKYTDSMNHTTKEFMLLNKPLFKRIEGDGYITYKVFDKAFCKTSLIKDFRKKYHKIFNQKYDDIYILRANSGELYITLAYIIDILIKDNESKNPLLVATQRYHIDLIELLCPTLPYIYQEINLKINKDMFEIDSYRVFILYNAEHFNSVEYNAKHRIPNTHYIKQILSKLNINPNNLSMRKITYSNFIEQSMQNKIKKIGLNLDNFIFLAPEAKSCEPYNKHFWILLTKKLQERGYDVFINLTDNNTDLKDIGRTCTLSYSEVFALAKYAKRIISLRSGIVEFLLQTNVDIDILYTNFIHSGLNSDDVIFGFGLKQVEFIPTDKLREFNTFEISPINCINQILKALN